MKYYSRIKELRQEAKLSQAEVAKILHCSQVGYGMYELGKRKISVEKLILLAQLYHVSLDYIVGLTDERQPYSAEGDKAQESDAEKVSEASIQTEADN